MKQRSLFNQPLSTPRCKQHRLKFGYSSAFVHSYLIESVKMYSSNCDEDLVSKNTFSQETLQNWSKPATNACKTTKQADVTWECVFCPLSPHKSSRATCVNDMSYISTFFWVAFLKMDCFLQELDFWNVLELVRIYGWIPCSYMQPRSNMDPLECESPCWTCHHIMRSHANLDCWNKAYTDSALCNIHWMFILYIYIFQS